MRCMHCVSSISNDLRSMSVVLAVQKETHSVSKSGMQVKRLQYGVLADEENSWGNLGLLFDPT